MDNKVAFVLFQDIQLRHVWRILNNLQQDQTINTKIKHSKIRVRCAIKKNIPRQPISLLLAMYTALLV